MTNTTTSSSAAAAAKACELEMGYEHTLVSIFLKFKLSAIQLNKRRQ